VLQGKGFVTMLARLKERAVSVLESNPLWYRFGLGIMESSSFFLPHESDFYGMPIVAENDTGLFLDIGANRGHSALGFHKVLPGWQTLSIEANPLHASRLERLKCRHGFFQYRIVAADRTSGAAVTIWTPRYRGFYCHSAAALDRAEAVRAIEKSFPRQARKFEYIPQETRTLALDELGVRPQIVKLDIQGKELDALRGLSGTITSCRPSFLIECNLDEQGIFDAMSGLNYLPFYYHRAMHRLVPADQGAPLSRNAFFLPAETVLARQLAAPGKRVIADND
jgi:FkbM family methyltransferase